MRICQLINFLFSIFLMSCTTVKVESVHEGKPITASWLKVEPRFALRDKDDEFLTHPFFDIDREFNVEKRTINFFVTTPEDSAFKYTIDLYSGRLYKDHNYCPLEDVWEGYKGNLERPNFTQGIVPQTYDQLGNPQRIIIFGKENLAEKFKYQPSSYDDVKIVGSLFLESCDSYPCDGNNRWKKAQILVAINERDPAFKNIQSLSDLKTRINWNYARSFLVNQDGVHQIGARSSPAFRISKEYSAEDTMKLFEKVSSHVKLTELTKWREKCFQLYDQFWNKSESIRKEKNAQVDKFFNAFKDFYGKYSQQFYSCQKLVRTGNINEDPRRTWFFAYIQAFTLLEKNQFYYSCNDKSWFANPLVDETHSYNDPMKELNRCSASNFEKSFEQAINGFSILQNQSNKNFRFIEYDSSYGGSHQKLYSWILKESKTMACKNKVDAKKEEQFDIFPQDVVWQNFVPDDYKTIK